MEQLVSDLGLRNRFHFLGWLDEPVELLFALDIFVSASETESFGLAIAEAMASETAVVSTATDGARELIENEQTGLLVPIKDVESLAQSISRLLNDGQLRSEMAKRARAAVETHFSLQRMVDEIEAIYTT